MARRETLGTKIDKLFNLREEIRADKKKLELKEDKLNALKSEVIDALHQEGLESSRGRTATVSISTSQEPSVADWDKFYTWMYRNKAAHMMYRRLNPKIFRETLELRKNRAIPGVETYDNVKLNILRRQD